MHVDPEKMIAVRAAGMSVAELHKHAHAGKFQPPQFTNRPPVMVDVPTGWVKQLPDREFSLIEPV
jgi:hypothetical protein